MDEYWNEALNEISDEHISEAIASKKKKKFPWLGAVAASLAAALLITMLLPRNINEPQVTPTDPHEQLASPSDPTVPSSNGQQTMPADPKDSTDPSGSTDPTFDITALSQGLIAEPEYPEMVAYPNDVINTEDPEGKFDTWYTALMAQYDQPEGYENGLAEFFTKAIPQLMADTGENAVCSPLNIYMTLAMLAETTGGNSRAALLELLNADSINALRIQANYVWNAHYRADGSASCLLANSLWLDEGNVFDQNTVDTLADSYYASVFQGDLGSDSMNNALQAWLSVQTQGLLDDYIKNVQMNEKSALTLASTVLYQAKWSSRFLAENNTEGVFHTPDGEETVTFMNKTLNYGPYYYGEDYSAVKLMLDPAGNSGDSAMWLILPDEGYDPQDILDSGYALEMILQEDETTRTSATVKVHLSLPKFDISAETDLKEGLTALGLGDLFSETEADFSGILPETQDAHLDKATHAARVAIDEEGVTAVAYTVMMVAGDSLPPEEEVYFTLDRSFLFVITSRDGLPLFVGMVNQP